LEAAEPNQIWQSDMTKIWAGPAVGWAYLVCVIDCCTREIVGWNLSHRCRTEDSLAAVEQSVLERLPEGSREARVTLTTDNGTQFTSTRFIETLNRLGITHRRTAYHHPEGNSYFERFHRSLKEEEVWTAEYRNVQEARQKLTIGLDLGDRWSFYCVLDEAGQVILEQKLPTTPEAMKQTFGKIPRKLIALETGTHSPWVSRLLSELGHEVIVAHAYKTDLTLTGLLMEGLGKPCSGQKHEG
jgi:integrase-like protein